MTAAGPGKGLKEGEGAAVQGSAQHREQPGIFTTLAGLVSRLGCQARQN